MLDFHKEIMVSWKYKFKGLFLTLMLSFLGNIYSFGAWCIHGWYSQHYLSAFAIFYSTTTISKFLTFMLALLLIYIIRKTLFSTVKIKDNMLDHPDFKK